MKIVGLIPFWINYSFPEESIQNRDTLIVAGSTMVNYLVNTLNKVDEIDEVFIYASDDQVVDHIAHKLEFAFKQRPRELDSQDVSIEEIIARFLDEVEADIIILAHPRCPFIKPSTIKSSVHRIVSGEGDSAFLVNKLQKFAWFKGQRLNYEGGKRTPNLIDVEPVVIETSSIYIFKKSSFNETGTRIGTQPLMVEVDALESFEVKSLDDFELAELIVNAGLLSKGDQV